MISNVVNACRNGKTLSILIPWYWSTWSFFVHGKRLCGKHTWKLLWNNVELVLKSCRKCNISLARVMVSVNDDNTRWSFIHINSKFTNFTCISYDSHMYVNVKYAGYILFLSYTLNQTRTMQLSSIIWSQTKHRRSELGIMI